MADREQIYRRIARLAGELKDELIAVRRDLHRYPELGWMEMRTASIVAETLDKLGFEVLTGSSVCRREARLGVPDAEQLAAHARWAVSCGAAAKYLTEEMAEGLTGVIGILRCGEGPVTALRFDMDALPIEEASAPGHLPAARDFCSQAAGVMHACGHDGHTAMGLGCARVLAQIRDELRGTVKLIFQPAEEGVRGARSIVEMGHLDDVDYFAGTHLAPAGGVNDGDLTPGTYGSLATTKYDVWFEGAEAHAVLGLTGISRHSGGQAICTRTVTAMASPLHTPEFDFDEQDLVKGCVFFAVFVYNCIDTYKEERG